MNYMEYKIRLHTKDAPDGRVQVTLVYSRDGGRECISRFKAPASIKRVTGVNVRLDTGEHCLECFPITFSGEREITVSPYSSSPLSDWVPMTAPSKKGKD